jgi:hypothetical protein
MFKRNMTKLGALGVVLGGSMVSANAAIPLVISETIADASATGVAVFAAVLVIGVPFLLYTFVKRIRKA